MEGLFIYFVGILAYNISPSLIAFGVAFWYRRKRYSISLLRGASVLVAGWLIGSIFAFLVFEALSMINIAVEDTRELQLIITLCILFPVMFQLFDATKSSSPPA